MKQLLATLAFGGVIALLVVTPVRGADREHQQMMADIRMLQEQTVRLELMLGTLDQSLTMLLTKLDAQDRDTRRAFADQKLLVGNLSSGVRIVREKVDETNVRGVVVGAGGRSLANGDSGEDVAIDPVAG